MSVQDPQLSRRQLLVGLWRPEQVSQQTPTGPLPNAGPQKAIIQGRFCLAYRNLTCTTCVEQCPEPGAIVVVDNVPSVNATACTGCGICHEVCPAPKNAVLLLSLPAKT